MPQAVGSTPLGSQAASFTSGTLAGRASQEVDLVKTRVGLRGNGYTHVCWAAHLPTPQEALAQLRLEAADCRGSHLARAK